MAIIEQVSQLKQQGLDEVAINQKLAEQGFSPNQIKEALDQSNVKSAVAETPGQEGVQAGMQPSMMQAPGESGGMPVPGQQAPQPGMDPGQQMQQTQQAGAMPGQELPPAPGQQPPAPAAQPAAQEQTIEPGQQMTGQQPMTQEEGAYPEEYPQEYAEAGGGGYQDYGYGQGIDTETMSDIAQQVVSEKLNTVKKQTIDLTKFKIETQGKLVSMNERLRRIEMIIDRLQTSILDKVGEYWKNVADLKQEMQATQDSFSKALPSLSKKGRKKAEPEKKTEKKKTTRKKTGTKRKGKRGRKRKDSFAHYLRS